MDNPAPDDLVTLIAALENAWLKGGGEPPALPDRPDLQSRLEGLLQDIRATQELALALAQGDLSKPLRAKGITAGALKTLQANLRHLTWQTQQIAQGDLSQRVDFMGEFAESFNSMARQIDRLQAQLHEQAIRDPLTNLFNRRYLHETLERELARAGRDTSPLSLIILDVDHFKQLNDTFGHTAGDLMLQALALVLGSRTRAGDVACRYGGEEFVVIMPGARPDIAYQRAEQLRSSFEAVDVHFGDTVLQATVSLGIAGFPEHAVTANELVHCADQALYAAKAAGRNRAIVWGA